MQNNRLFNAASSISPKTITLLNLILPFLLVEFIWFAASFITTARLDPLRAIDIYNPMIEYLMMSLLLTLGGGIIFDIAISNK